MKKTIFLALTASVVILASNGCKKDDDNFQPAGSYVTKGANNNTVQSYTFTIDSAQWTADVPNLEWSGTYTMSPSANVTGGVFLYAQDDSTWSPLPHVDYGITFEFGFNPTTKIIEVQSADAKSAVMIPNPGSMNFRLVTIPSAMRKANPEMNWRNYAEVKRIFNL